MPTTSVMHKYCKNSMCLQAQAVVAAPKLSLSPGANRLAVLPKMASGRVVDAFVVFGDSSCVDVLKQVSAHLEFSL